MSEKRYEYKIETSGSEGLQRMLNEHGEQGWRVVAVQFHSPVLETPEGVNLSIILFELEKL